MRKINYLYCCLGSLLFALVCAFPYVLTQNPGEFCRASLVAGICGIFIAIGFLIMHLYKMSQKAAHEYDKEQNVQILTTLAKAKSTLEQHIYIMGENIYTIMKILSEEKSRSELIVLFAKNISFFLSDAQRAAWHLVSSIEKDAATHQLFRDVFIELARLQATAEFKEELIKSLTHLLRGEVERENDPQRKKNLQRYEEDLADWTIFLKS